MKPIDLLTSSAFDVFDDHPEHSGSELVGRFLRRHWRVLVRWIAAGACVGGLIAALAPAQYSAHAIILLEDESSRPVSEPSRPPRATDPGYADTQIQVLNSDEVISRAVDDKRLTEDEEFGRAGVGLYADVRSLALSALGSRQDGGNSKLATVRRVQGAISLRRLGLSSAVDIGFTTRSPLRSAVLANAIAQSYIDGQRIRQQTARQDEALNLQERMAALQQDIAAAEQTLQDTAAAASLGEQAKVRFREAQNKLDVFRALYNSLLQRSLSDRGDSPSVSASARIITNAEPPLRRSWWRPLILFGAAGLAGAIAGLAHACVRHLKDRSIRTLEEIRPICPPGRVDGIAEIKDGWTAPEAACKDLQATYARQSNLLCAALSKAAVRLRGQHRRMSRIIAVVAPHSGAGASSIAAHLARIIANSEKKVLLIDANWRKPTPADRMLISLDTTRWLSKTLLPLGPEPRSLDVLMLRATPRVPDLNAALSIMSSLDDLPDEYDCVIVDFHALDQAVDFEASSSVPKDVVIVAEAGKTSEEDLRKLLQLVPRDQILAVILNKIPAERLAAMSDTMKTGRLPALRFDRHLSSS